MRAWTGRPSCFAQPCPIPAGRCPWPCLWPEPSLRVPMAWLPRGPLWARLWRAEDVPERDAGRGLSSSMARADGLTFLRLRSVQGG